MQNEAGQSPREAGVDAGLYGHAEDFQSRLRWSAQASDEIGRRDIDPPKLRVHISRRRPWQRKSSISLESVRRQERLRSPQNQGVGSRQPACGPKCRARVRHRR